MATIATSRADAMVEVQSSTQISVHQSLNRNVCKVSTCLTMQLVDSQRQCRPGTFLHSCSCSFPFSSQSVSRSLFPCNTPPQSLTLHLPTYPPKATFFLSFDTLHLHPPLPFSLHPDIEFYPSPIRLVSFVFFAFASRRIILCIVSFLFSSCFFFFPCCI